MKNFFRAARLALRYRTTLVASIVCSIMVAVLWGGNIGAVYPVVEVVFKNQSLHDWVDQKIATGEEEIARLDAEISELQKPQAKEDRNDQAIEVLQLQRATEADALSTYEKLQPYIHSIFPDDPFQTLVIVIVALLVGTIVKDLFLIAGSILVDRLAQLATFDLRKQFYRRTLELDVRSFKDNSTSDLMARFTNDMSQVTLGIQIFYGRALREPMKMIACLVGAAIVCWQLLLLTLVVVPIAVWLLGRLAKSIKRTSRRAMEEMSSFYNILNETFSGIKIVKAFTMERYERKRFHLRSKEIYRQAMKIARYNSLLRPLTELMGIAMVSMAILSGAYLVLNQETHLLGIRMSDRPLSFGSLMLFYGLLAGVSDPARKLADVFGHLQRGTAAADRIYEFFDREPAVADPVHPVTPKRHCCDIVLEDVQFYYEPEEQVLNGVNLKIPFGETIAIVGPNGSGKSTLCNLVARFHDPIEGRILLDGIDLRDMRRRDLRRQIGLVTQEPLLFDDTIEANIRYGAPHASISQVITAAKQAHAHQFIMDKLQHGYDTMVGSRGLRLSGGQRQRISLARAILRDPSILILDEATSQIDVESEQLIQRVLANFTRDRTTFIITHRMGILSLADHILVLDHGRVLDFGDHDELIGRCELYRRLYQADFRESA